jgi:hypothetical protein
MPPSQEMPPRRSWSGLCRLNGDVVRHILEVGERICRDKTEVQPIPNRQLKLLDFVLTYRKHSASQFLIDNFGACLMRRPPQHLGAKAGRTLPSNRQSPELETDLSHRKQRTENFLIAKFRRMYRSRPIQNPNFLTSKPQCPTPSLNREYEKLENPVSHRKQRIGQFLIDNFCMPFGSVRCAPRLRFRRSSSRLEHRWRGKELGQYQVRGDVNHSHEHHPDYRNMQRCRPECAMEQRINERKIDIQSWVAHPSHDDGSRGNRRLQLPSSPIVSYALERPDEQNRPHDMEQRNQSHPQRESRVPHILRSARQVMSREEPPRRVQIPEQVSHDGRHRLARQQQGIAPPESGARQDYGDVAYMKKIHRAPGSPVRRNPHGQPYQARPAHPSGKFGRSHKRLAPALTCHRIKLETHFRLAHRAEFYQPCVLSHGRMEA